jgi:hypothetical protein
MFALAINSPGRTEYSLTTPAKMNIPQGELLILALLKKECQEREGG